MFQLCNCLVSYSRLFRSIRLFLTVLLVCVCVNNTTLAVDIDDLVVTEGDGVYHIIITGNVAANEEYVRQVLTDYVHLYRLSDSVIESRVLESSDGGKVKIQSLVLFCFTVFCREVMRVDEISVLESGDLRSVIIPEQSDFSSGYSTWKITPMGSSTHLTYVSSVEPDFFIPPLLGAKILRNYLSNEFKTMFCRIEHIALINEAREQDDFTFAKLSRITNSSLCRKKLMAVL